MPTHQLSESEAALYSLIYNVTNEVLNTISMFSAIFVICAISYLRWKHKSMSNRVSLRLQTYIAISDMFFAIFQVMSVNSRPPGNWVCHVAPWGFVFTALLGCFLNVAIAFNLQLIFVHNYINTHRFEKFYIIISLILSILLSTLPVSFNALGFDETEISCWYRNGSTLRGILWQWTTLHAWILLSILYCIFSVVIIIIRLNHATKSFISMNRYAPNSLDIVQDRSYQRQLIMNQAVKRIILYPVVPVVTFLFNIISNFVFFSTKQNQITLQMLSNIGTSSRGLLNLLVFCLDPAMKKVWSVIFEKFKVSDAEINENNVSDKPEEVNQSEYHLL